MIIPSDQEQSLLMLTPLIRVGDWAKPKCTLLRLVLMGHLSGSVVEPLPSAHVMVPGSWDGVPRQAPCSSESLLLHLLLPLLILSLK